MKNYVLKTTDSVVESVVKKLDYRSLVGVNKYGTTLDDNDNDDFLNHLQEELLDASLYIQKLKKQSGQVERLKRAIDLLDDENRYLREENKKLKGGGFLNLNNLSKAIKEFKFDSEEYPLPRIVIYSDMSGEITRNGIDSMQFYSSMDMKKLINNLSEKYEERNL